MSWFVDGARIPLGAWVKDLIDFLKTYASWLFDFFATTFLAVYDAATWIFTTPPGWVIILVIAGVAFWAKGWKLALGTVLGLMLVDLVAQWDNAMLTLALTVVAVFIATTISIPLGIWAARSQTVSNIVRPVLDFLQTMPAFVYLVPAVILFSPGKTPALIATTIYAVVPMVRMTNLGIVHVDKEMVEAASAFGSTKMQLLSKVQIPQAMPAIMAGLNQTIMMAMSMVVTCALIGANGLGMEILLATNRTEMGKALMPGISIVIVAIILDRLTQGLIKKEASTE